MSTVGAAVALGGRDGGLRDTRPVGVFEWQAWPNPCSPWPPSAVSGSFGADRAAGETAAPMYDRERVEDSCHK